MKRVKDGMSKIDSQINKASVSVRQGTFLKTDNWVDFYVIYDLETVIEST